MDARGLRGHVAPRVDQRMEMLSGGQVVDQFQRRDLDHPVAVQRIETRGFGIEQHGAEAEVEDRFHGFGQGDSG